MRIVVAKRITISRRQVASQTESNPKDITTAIIKKTARIAGLRIKSLGKGPTAIPTD